MYCIYHSRDFDGYCSGAIVKKKYPDSVLIGYDYGQAIPFNKIEKGQPIILVDVSFDMNDMVMMGLHSGNQFTWIDHHQSAIVNFESLKKGNPTKASFINPVLKQGIAACEITWGYLFPDVEMPISVHLLGQFDTYRNDNKSNWNLSVLPFQYGLKTQDITTAGSFPQDLLSDNVQFEVISSIIKTGNLILSYQQQIDAVNMKCAFEIKFEGLKTIACNGSGLGSMAFDSVPNLENYDLMMPFKFNGKVWSFSLYTAKDEIDCSELAKKYGGGGHKEASGFIMNEIPDFLL